MNSRRIVNGTWGGLAGGLVFGAMMGMMGMLPMVGRLVGHPTATAGFLVHMANSAVIGVGFAVVFDRFATASGRALRYGLLYGAIWWLLGPLTLMPLFLGMGLGVNWNLAAAVAMVPSLAGHMMYGAVLGIAYTRLKARARHGGRLEVASARGR